MDILGQMIKWVIENVSTAFAAFFGTFLGAWFAFLFERCHKKRLRLETNSIAGRQAQFALISQLNAMRNIRKQYLAPYQKEKLRHLTLPPFEGLVDLPKLPLNNLAFFLEDKGAQILNESMLAEHRYSTFVAALEYRNIRHENMQHVVATAEPEKGIDEATRVILKDMTDSLYVLAEDITTHHESSIRAIRDYLKKRFPKHTALDFE